MINRLNFILVGVGIFAFSAGSASEAAQKALKVACKAPSQPGDFKEIKSANDDLLTAITKKPEKAVVGSDNSLPKNLVCAIKVLKEPSKETLQTFKISKLPIFGKSYDMSNFKIGRTKGDTIPGKVFVKTSQYQIAERSHTFDISRTLTPRNKRAEVGDAPYVLSSTVSTILRVQKLDAQGEPLSDSIEDLTLAVDLADNPSKPQFIPAMAVSVSLSCELADDPTFSKMPSEIPAVPNGLL